MSIVIVCPGCQARLNVEEKHAGKAAKCPRCQGVIQVPAVEDGAVRSSPPPVVAVLPPQPPAARNFPDLEDDDDRREPPRQRRRPRDDEDDDDDDNQVRRRLEPHRGGLILALGIISLLVCGPVGIAAWVMGSADLQAMRRGTMDPTGQGPTQAGYICGIIASVFMAIGLVVGCGLVMLAATTGR